jgi:hypothetical protein
MHWIGYAKPKWFIGSKKVATACHQSKVVEHLSTLFSTLALSEFPLRLSRAICIIDELFSSSSSSFCKSSSLGCYGQFSREDDEEPIKLKRRLKSCAQPFFLRGRP